ncbi:MAG: hypothetical protein MJA29_02000, partial [Candidatus Omnitrophica bacterium]|nr:hypothetical protein [Candidatus Omnitrophota bacterium]
MNNLNYDDFIGLLLSDVRGRIYAANMYSAHYLGLLEKQLLQTYLIDCFDFFKIECIHRTSLINIKELLLILEEVASKKDRDDNVKYLFKCNDGAERFINEVALCNVIEKEILFQYYIDETMLISSHLYMNYFSDPSIDDVGIVIKKINETDNVYKNGYLGGNERRPFFWITQMYNIEGYKISANRLRDVMGLIHYDDNKDLIEVSFSSSVLKKRSSEDDSFVWNRPTIIEGGSHSRFNSSIHSESKNKCPYWGWTVDLKKFADGIFDFDGVPEIVVSPMILNEEIRPKLEYIGRITITRGLETGKDDDEKYEEVLDG